MFLECWLRPVAAEPNREGSESLGATAQSSGGKQQGEEVQTLARRSVSGAIALSPPPGHSTKTI